MNESDRDMFRIETSPLNLVSIETFAGETLKLSALAFDNPWVK